MNEMYTDLEMLNKTEIVPGEKLEGLGMNRGGNDCIDCHYISSDCAEPCFC